MELNHVKLISHGHILSLVLLVLAHITHVVHRWVESADVWQRTADMHYHVLVHVVQVRHVALHHAAYAVVVAAHLY